MQYEKLIEDYPRLFRQVKSGVECGPGWEPILRKLCEDIGDDRGVEFTQVKETFGELTVHYTCDKIVEPDVLELVHRAAEESLKICEECGQRGRRNSSGYTFRTRCKPCRKK